MPEEEIGKVTHFFNKISVAVLSLTGELKKGDKIRIEASEPFVQDVSSMEVDHKPIEEAKAGEFVPRGAFMIYGKKNHLTAELKLAIGLKDSVIVGGPVDAVSSQTDNFVIIIQGNEKTSDTAKKIKKKLKAGSIDEIIRMLPAGGCKIR